MPKIHAPAVLAMLASLLAVSPAMADIVTRNIDYKLPSGVTAKGYAVYDDSVEGKQPGILVIPEWWGINEYPKTRARQLAEMGYVAFVADMYGDGKVVTTAQDAQRLSGVAYEAGLAELAAPALEELKKLEQVDTSRIAAIGFCFGGSTVADMVKAGMDIRAGVSFHGGLSPDAAPESGLEVKTAMLVLHGGADPMVPPDAVSGYVQKCVEAGVPITFVSFPKAVHAFSNPNADRAGITGVAYDEQAAQTSWQIMEHFLRMTLE